MAGRIFVLEPAVGRAHSGHNLMSHKLLSQALAGVEQFYVLGVDASTDIPGLNGTVLPLFPRGFVRLTRRTERAGRKPHLRLLKRLMPRFPGYDTFRFAKVLARLIADRHIGPIDHLVVTSGSTTLLGVVLPCLRALPVAVWPQLHVRMFAQRFDDPTPDVDAVMIALRGCQTAAPGKVHVYTETKALKAMFEQRYGLSGIGLFLLPIAAPTTAVAPKTGSDFTIGFFGPVRRDKGAPRLAPILAALMALRPSSGLAGGLRFVFQDDGGRHARALRAALQPLSRAGLSVEALPGMLDDVAFAEAIGRCDALLLPYDAAVYVLRGSAIVSDAVAMRVPFVISRGMAMAEWTADGNGLTATTDAEFAATLAEIERNRTEFSAAAGHAAARMAQANADNPMVARIMRASAQASD